MIGNWRSKDSYVPLVQRVSILISMTRLLWKEAKNGSFFVKTCFDLLEGGRQQLVPFKMLWNPIVPTKVVSLLGKFGGVGF